MRRPVIASLMLACASSFAPSMPQFGFQRQSCCSRSMGSRQGRMWTSTTSAIDEEDDQPEYRFEGLESVDEAMWRRVRTELYGGPDYAAPAALRRFEEHCELRRAACTEDWINLEGGRRCVYAEQQYPNLTATPVWEVERDPRFEWIRALATGYYEELREEVRVRSKGLPMSIWKDPNATLEAMEEERLGGYGMIHLHAGKANIDSRCPRHLFPRCVRALRAVDAPIAPRYASIARQRAGRSLRQHTDRIPWMLTCHVPLFGPQRAAYMLVDGQRCNWTPGKPTVIDTTFQHSAHNEDSKEDMHLLHIDFFHPDLSREEMHAMRILHRHLQIAKTQRTKELKPIVSLLEVRH